MNLRSDLDDFTVTFSIEQVRSMPDKDAAEFADGRIRLLERRDKLTFAERGFLMLEMETRELWKHIPHPAGGFCHSLNHWIHDASPDSNGTCYAALAVAQSLSGVIPAEELNDVKRCNLEILSKLSTATARQPDVRMAAKGKEEDFVAKIKRDYPHEHIEAKRPMHFKPDESQRDAIDEALRMAAVLEEAMSREEALTCLAVSYSIDHRDEYNREMAKRKQAFSNIGQVVVQ